MSSKASRLVIGAVTEGNKFVLIGEVVVGEAFDPTGTWRVLFETVEQRVRHKYRQMVATPTTISCPDKYQWKEQNGPYSRLS